MSVAEMTATTIRLERDDEDAACAAFAASLYLTLAHGPYDYCSVLPIPESLDEWRATHRTARKRAAHAERLGYRFAEIARHEYVDDIFTVNTSSPERQGRRMSAGYWERPSSTPLPDYPCPRHAIRQNGVLDSRGRLVAYLWMYRAGELALVSSILGHAEHLRGDVMYLLFSGALEGEVEHGGFCVYNRHDSGTEGLRFFKERLGFVGTRVSWELA